MLLRNQPLYKLRLLKAPWTARSSNQSILKEINPEFTGRTVAVALVLWPPNAKSWLTGNNPDAGKDWQQEKGVIEGEMVGWHHQLNGHEFEQTLGDSEGQGSLAYCSPWDCRELDTTEQLNSKYKLNVSQHVHCSSVKLGWGRRSFPASPPPKGISGDPFLHL